MSSFVTLFGGVLSQKTPRLPQKGDSAWKKHAGFGAKLILPHGVAMHLTDYTFPPLVPSNQTKGTPQSRGTLCGEQKKTCWSPVGNEGMNLQGFQRKPPVGWYLLGSFPHSLPIARTCSKADRLNFQPRPSLRVKGELLHGCGGGKHRGKSMDPLIMDGNTVNGSIDYYYH